jgi:serine/threonine protein kinase
MVLDLATEGYFKLIEARRDIGGRFINIRRLGTGYFSLVFVATDNTSNREVAIKVFRPEYLTQSYRFQCFCREAVLLNQLRGSKNVLDWIAPQGEFTEQVRSTTGIPFDFRFPYFAVELASSDVGEAVRTGSWSAERKLLGFREMCKGVQRIHRKGISHRDLKPSNFLVMKDGEVKLSDFGTARDIYGSDPPLMPDYVLAPGDTRYSAPEMLALLHDVDASIAFYGDFYALGGTLFELWSGTILGLQLFDGKFVSDLVQSMNAVHKRDRLRTYLGFVQNIAGGHPLPPIAAFSGGMPSSISKLVEGLYQSMSALDYRRRLCDFERIFLRIDQCLLVLRNEEKVRKWSQQKQLFRINREEKQAQARQRIVLLSGRGVQR